jgi:hypothetical protein
LELPAFASGASVRNPKTQPGKIWSAWYPSFEFILISFWFSDRDFLTVVSHIMVCIDPIRSRGTEMRLKTTRANAYTPAISEVIAGLERDRAANAPPRKYYCEPLALIC